LKEEGSLISSFAEVPLSPLLLLYFLLFFFGLLYGKEAKEDW